MNMATQDTEMVDLAPDKKHKSGFKLVIHDNYFDKLAKESQSQTEKIIKIFNDLKLFLTTVDWNDGGRHVRRFFELLNQINGLLPELQNTRLCESDKNKIGEYLKLMGGVKNLTNVLSQFNFTHDDTRKDYDQIFIKLAAISKSRSSLEFFLNQKTSLKESELKDYFTVEEPPSPPPSSPTKSR